jgi:hypothetical protein
MCGCCKRHVLVSVVKCVLVDTDTKTYFCVCVCVCACACVLIIKLQHYSLSPTSSVFAVTNTKEYCAIATGKPTFWPADRNKLPDLVGFCVTEGIPQDFAVQSHALTYPPIIPQSQSHYQHKH